MVDIVIFVYTTLFTTPFNVTGILSLTKYTVKKKGRSMPASGTRSRDLRRCLDLYPNLYIDKFALVFLVLTTARFIFLTFSDTPSPPEIIV